MQAVTHQLEMSTNVVDGVDLSMGTNLPTKHVELSEGLHSNQPSVEPIPTEGVTPASEKIGLPKEVTKGGNIWIE